MIDAMGLCGAQGEFRSLCVEVMKVLRRQREVLLTILEVLLHDPLHRWAVCPLKALKSQTAERAESQQQQQQQLSAAGVTLPVQYQPRRVQRGLASSGGPTSQLASSVGASPDADSLGNITAEHMLLKVKSKLQGIECGNVMSPEAQVAHLLNEAQDWDIQSRMYAGWSAWV